MLLLGFLLVSVPGLSSRASAATGDAPLVQRRSGLWETQAVVMGMSSVVRQCVVKENDDLASKLAARRNADCSQAELHRDGNQLQFHALCQAAGHEVRTEGTITGDFESSYQGQLTVTIKPPVNGQETTRIDISAHWVGPCDGASTTVDIPGQGRIDLNDPKVQEMLRNLRQQMGN